MIQRKQDGDNKRRIIAESTYFRCEESSEKKFFRYRTNNDIEHKV